MRCNKIFLSLVAVLFVAECFSQALDNGKLNEYVKLMKANDRFMGTVLVYQHGKKVYSNGLGFSNIESGAKSDDQTMYRIGSISKTITATLILKAIEEGKINFSDKIATFFPSIEHADQITINQLLNHHSGIHNFTGGNFLSWNAQPKNRHDLVDSIAKGGNDFPPGSKAAYSNSNYVLLSFILEDIYHQSYGEILNDKIIKPFHLKHFQFGDKLIDPKNKTLSYYFEAGWNVFTETDLSIPMGAGAILSSGEDLAKVLDAIFHSKIISREMLDKMEAQSDGFGLGLFEKNILEKNAYTHDGAIDGFNSYFYYFPQDETIYVLLSNAENYNLETVNNSMLSIIFNKPVNLPKIDRYAVTAGELQQYLGTYKSQTSPLIIDISSKNNFLLAQPRGQRIYTMEATDKNKFLHVKTEVTLEFIPSASQMVMKQGPQTIVFTKQ
ncbi:serine hydrolase domain-containing protein [Danxiaibacter flavus]|uniref:Serine hydrolase domain-containing protein n=1 Tax=Danxiaibacter flavus TaxID=3049108 RepID=A0ABV3ZLR0_9BACT|nr:serine hydrolase domain-containing protein [Chitinophagaceae bacterium DXS]